MKAAEAFASAAFSSNETEFAASNPEVRGEVLPSTTPVMMAKPASVDEQYLLTLEERVARIERVLKVWDEHILSAASSSSCVTLIS